jgi:maltooligosyltrehalose trehalohydrolase
MTPSDFLFGPRIEGEHAIFRLWAPGRQQVDLIIPGEPPVPMIKQEDGFFVVSKTIGEGTRYKFRSDALEFPDPASRQQDGDTRGWSVVRNDQPIQSRFSRPWHETVICEVHVGAATPEGTFSSLMNHLEHFRDAGYTALEIMPINEFPGSRNWGYDGTLIFAPECAYGTPDDLKALVARAHDLGLTMILDVVYNHFGSVDNFQRQYVPEWFDENVTTPWGPGINVANEMVRKFYYENAVMWLRDFGFDGLRFDAIHEIKSPASDRFLGELAQACWVAKPAAKLIIENMDNAFTWLERDAANKPMKFTAQWNDDMHHVMTYLVTGEGRRTGYDDPSKDPLADLQKALENGFVHDREEGPQSDGRTRGGPAGKLPPDSFITYVENHDQIGNRADAMRLSARIEPRQLDFLHFVKFIAPQIPLCFMGDEANLRSGFPFFVDFNERDGREADARRYKEMREIFKEGVADGALPHPNDPRTFSLAKLPWSDFAHPEHLEAIHRFRQLARWRREKVWPLTATPCLDAFGTRHEHGVIVNWRFERGTLSLVYNASSTSQDMPCLVQGAPVSTGDYHQYGEVLRLGPWSALAWNSLK